jgi:coproporphyrinogen III oxidase
MTQLSRHASPRDPSPLPDDVTIARRKKEARVWFEDLRDRICAEFERIEDELQGTHRDKAPGRFERKT